MLQSLIPFEYFARAGGGGSSSGNGGNGSGIPAIVGYALIYYISKPFKRFLPRKIAFFITIPLVVITNFIALLAAVSSGTYIGWWVCVEFIIGTWVGWTGQMFSFWEKIKKKLQKTDEDITRAGWNETELHQIASQIFARYQYDWSYRDSSHFSEYMTTHFAAHSSLMIRALTEMNRQNIITNLEIIKIDTSRIYDNTNDNQDMFSVYIEADADDRIIDLVNQKDLYIHRKPFIEEWTFQRNGAFWMLANIRQSTEEQGMSESSFIEFAAANNMFYSLDMGWLFIPARGVLFGDSKQNFGKSDINNHIIGTYNSLLVQLYTYRKAADSNGHPITDYIVGQINVPKQYGGILIERNKGFILRRIFPPKGYQKYEYEWPDFNRRYIVYATEQSRLASFELLNPGFMAFLYDNFNDISIEVVDNIIYFYTPKTGSTNDYGTLVQLLLKAFKELQI